MVEVEETNVQGVPMRTSRKRSKPYQPATFQANVNKIASVKSTALLLADPAMMKFQFNRAPPKAARPTNAPR